MSIMQYTATCLNDIAKVFRENAEIAQRQERAAIRHYKKDEFATERATWIAAAKILESTVLKEPTP